MANAVLLSAADPVALAQILIDQHRFYEAGQVIQAALIANPRVSDLHRIHGDLLFREGHLSEAGLEYRAAFDLDRKNHQALYGRAKVAQANGLRAQAAALGFDIGADTDTAPKESWQLLSPYQHYQFPYRVKPDGRRGETIDVALSINGVKTELRLDTGAHGITLSSRFAARARIQEIRGSSESGIGSTGNINTWIGSADSLQVGSLTFKHAVVQVTDQGSKDQTGGLLGTDIFRRFLIKFDFVNHRIDLDPLFGPPWDGISPVDRYDGPELKGFTPVFQLRHYLLIPAIVSQRENSDRTSTLFLIDTGAAFSSIATELARSVATVRKNHHMSVKGVSGNVENVFEADRVFLQFAGFQQPILRMPAFDLSNISSSAGLEVGGILGLPALAEFPSLSIDYRDAAVRFDFKP